MRVYVVEQFDEETTRIVGVAASIETAKAMAERAAVTEATELNRMECDVAKSLGEQGPARAWEYQPLKWETPEVDGLQAKGAWYWYAIVPHEVQP